MMEGVLGEHQAEVSKFRTLEEGLGTLPASVFLSLKIRGGYFSAESWAKG